MTVRPGDHPPPPELSGVALPLTLRDAVWFRHHRPDLAPVFFGRTGECRFDAPAPERSFGVLYLAADVHGALIETFGHGQIGRAHV